MTENTAAKLFAQTAIETEIGPWTNTKSFKMNTKIKIVVEQLNDTDHSLHLFVNDELIDVGHFGGEPEDNSYYRDYDWVVPAFKRLAEKLNIPCEFEEIEL